LIKFCDSKGVRYTSALRHQSLVSDVAEQSQLIDVAWFTLAVIPPDRWSSST